jgi:polynucleotide 5'-hydroxyl-kinase GRC3/NOL9
MRAGKLHIPGEWRAALEEIAKKPGLYLILGGADAGKSTLAKYLIGGLSSMGCGVSLVDADIGQKDVGPPATVSLARASPAGLGELRVEAMYFVGSFSPRGHFLPLLTGVKLMVEKASTEFVLVNTTGYIRGAGEVLKSYKIELLAPEAVIALQRGRELEGILGSNPYVRAIKLPVSEKARRKKKKERRAAREKAFREYFRHSSIVEVSSKLLTFQRGPPPGKEHVNLLCGLANEKNECLGLGLIKGVEEDRISLLTPIDRGFCMLQLGSVFLPHNFFKRDGLN